MLNRYDGGNAEAFLKGLGCITGIPYKKLKSYASTNNLFNILEHPRTIEPNQQQLKKISLLNEFISSYRLLKMQEKENRIRFSNSSYAGEYFTSILGGIKDKEKFMVAFLDSGNNIIETRIISEGSLSETVVHPRDILKGALDSDCRSIVMAHNHPGTSMKASQQDMEITERIVSIFKPLEINILDHIIVAGVSYFSFAEHGYMPEGSASKASYEPIVIDNCAKAEGERVEVDSMKVQKFESQIEEEDEWEI